MKNTSKTFSLIAVIFLLSFIVSGCASKNAATQQVDRSDWEWVPSVWVEDNSFSGNQYSHCAYDQETAWYYCPPGTK